jgi:hypothetical protein
VLAAVSEAVEHDLSISAQLLQCRISTISFLDRQLFCGVQACMLRCWPSQMAELPGQAKPGHPAPTMQHHVTDAHYRLVPFKDILGLLWASSWFQVVAACPAPRSGACRMLCLFLATSKGRTSILSLIRYDMLFHFKKHFIGSGTFLQIVMILQAA